jgi:hypothetical protein
MYCDTQLVLILTMVVRVTIYHTLLSSQRVTLRCQEEMVEGGMESNDTSAATAMYEALN